MYMQCMPHVTLTATSSNKVSRSVREVKRESAKEVTVVVDRDWPSQAAELTLVYSYGLASKADVSLLTHLLLALTSILNSREHI